MNYEQKSELLTIQLRRDELLNMAWACDKVGKIGLAKELYSLAEIREGK